MANSPLGSLHKGMLRLPPRPPLLLQSTEMKTEQNCPDLLLSSDPSRVGVGGVRGDADNIGPVAGQLGLDVGELLHQLPTLPVSAVEDNNQVSERKEGIFIFIFTFLLLATHLPLY